MYLCSIRTSKGGCTKMMWVEKLIFVNFNGLWFLYNRDLIL